MGVIICQLKFYVCKGGEEFFFVDICDVVFLVLFMMEFQFKICSVDLICMLLQELVLIFGDWMCLEQVIINLLCNVLDVIKGEDVFEVEVLLLVGDMVMLLVWDNGQGIQDFDVLFEFFYIIKQFGDGVGLGFVIFLGIVNDLGGCLIVWNGVDGGVVFEV